MTKIRCVLCGNIIMKHKWAIRDYDNETYQKWIYRHIRQVLTRWFRRYIPFYLPVCQDCVDELSGKVDPEIRWLK